VLAAEGGELMAMIQLAMHGGLTIDHLENMIFAHPTFAEMLNSIAGAIPSP